MASLAPRQDGVQETFLRVRAATSDETGFTEKERDEHIRQITATVMEARIRGRLVNGYRFRAPA
jgi:adenylylsulfate kinase-like enzyme